MNAGDGHLRPQSGRGGDGLIRHAEICGMSEICVKRSCGFSKQPVAIAGCSQARWSRLGNARPRVVVEERAARAGQPGQHSGRLAMQSVATLGRSTRKACAACCADTRGRWTRQLRRAGSAGACGRAGHRPTVTSFVPVLDGRPSLGQRLTLPGKLPHPAARSAMRSADSLPAPGCLHRIARVPRLRTAGSAHATWCAAARRSDTVYPGVQSRPPHFAATRSGATLRRWGRTGAVISPSGHPAHGVPRGADNRGQQPCDPPPTTSQGRGNRAGQEGAPVSAVASRAESASSILVTRSEENPQGKDPGVSCCPAPGAVVHH